MIEVGDLVKFKARVYYPPYYPYYEKYKGFADFKVEDISDVDHVTLSHPSLEVTGRVHLGDLQLC